MTLSLPPTRNHRQLSRWVNDQRLIDDQGRPVVATIARVRTNTDQKIRGTRLRRPGNGREGLLLEITVVGSPFEVLYRHESSETYRRHAEARAWIARHLHPPKM